MCDTSREDKVFDFLQQQEIEYSFYRHPEAPTIEIARQYWHNDGSKHCKNLFFRNHKGNRHYLVVFDSEQSMAIHDLEQKLKQGKLSFASEQRMERYLGLRPGSVSPFGLINDMNLTDSDGAPVEGVAAKELFENGHRVKLFLDKDLQSAERLSFHPCDNTASTVVDNAGFMKYLSLWGGEYEWIDINPEE